MCHYRIRYNTHSCPSFQPAPWSLAPSDDVRPRFVKFAGVFYGLMALTAALWNAFRGRAAFPFGDVALGLALGFLAAGATVLLGLAAYRTLPVMRKIASELAPRLLDGTSRADLVLVSVFSGVGEEVLFRGALQPEVGLVLASVIFGAVHVGPDRRYLVWTAWALLAGFLFGALYETTGGLIAPVVAHVLHNAATFLLWKRSRRSSTTEGGQ